MYLCKRRLKSGYEFSNNENCKMEEGVSGFVRLHA